MTGSWFYGVLDRTAGGRKILRHTERKFYDTQRKFVRRVADTTRNRRRAEKTIMGIGLKKWRQAQVGIVDAPPPKWVNRATLIVGQSLPVYPDQRTSSDRRGMSGWCHFRTHAPQAFASASHR